MSGANLGTVPPILTHWKSSPVSNIRNSKAGCRNWPA